MGFERYFHDCMSMDWRSSLPWNFGYSNRCSPLSYFSRYRNFLADVAAPWKEPFITAGPIERYQSALLYFLSKHPKWIIGCVCIYICLCLHILVHPPTITNSLLAVDNIHEMQFLRPQPTTSSPSTLKMEQCLFQDPNPHLSSPVFSLGIYQRALFPLGLLMCPLGYGSKPHCALWGVATTWST